MATPRPVRTPTPAPSSDLHDEEKTYQEDPGGWVHFPRFAWNIFRKHRLTFFQIDYLAVTETWVRQGNGKGCWASTRHIGNKIGVNERNTAAIRAKLIKLGLLVQVGTEIKNGSVLPKFKTLWSDLGVKPPPKKPPRTPLSRATDTPPVARDRQLKTEKTKDKKTSGTRPAAEIPTEDKRVPFIINEQPATATHDKLARALHQKLLLLPPQHREGRGLHHQFPSKVWPDRMRKFIKANWSQGETAVLLQFERLMKVWDKIDPGILPDPKRLYSNGNSYYYLKILLPAIDKAEQSQVAVPEHLERPVEEVLGFGWPGDKSAVSAACVRTAASLKALKLRVGALAEKAIVRTAGKNGGTITRPGLPHHVAAGRLADRLEGLTVRRFMSMLHEIVQALRGKDPDYAPDYFSPKYTLTTTDFSQNLVFKKLVADAAKSENVVSALISSIKESR